MRTTFNVGDWVAHTPKHILAKNFGVDASVFDDVPSPNPYILAGAASARPVAGAGPGAPSESGAGSFVHRTLAQPAEPAPGGGGVLRRIDSASFPASRTIAAALVVLAPGGLRELHWHPNAEEWLYFHRGAGRATVFVGNAAARTFDFGPGDTAAFPDNSG